MPRNVVVIAPAPIYGDSQELLSVAENQQHQFSSSFGGSTECIRFAVWGSLRTKGSEKGPGTVAGEFSGKSIRDCSPLRVIVRKRGRVQKSMGHKVPLETGMLLCRPVTSRRLTFLRKETVLPRCNFATTPGDSLHSEFSSPEKLRDP